jgi:hypothetical protein
MLKIKEVPVFKMAGGKIYYTVASNMGSINANKITSAVNEYNRKPIFQWIPFTNLSSYVEFVFGSSSGSDGWAHIGYQGESRLFHWISIFP